MSAFWSRRPLKGQPGAESHRKHADKCRQGRESTARQLGDGPLVFPAPDGRRLGIQRFRRLVVGELEEVIISEVPSTGCGRPC